MARRHDHRRGHHHPGERLQPLHLREEQGETTSVDTPAGTEADRGRRRELELLQSTCMCNTRPMCVLCVTRLQPHNTYLLHMHLLT